MCDNCFDWTEEKLHWKLVRITGNFAVFFALNFNHMSFFCVYRSTQNGCTK